MDSGDTRLSLYRVQSCTLAAGLASMTSPQKGNAIGPPTSSEKSDHHHPDLARLVCGKRLQPLTKIGLGRPDFLK